MYDYVFELGVNLFQCFLYFGFLYLFFEKKYNKRKNIILFTAFIILFFIVLTYFTFTPPFFNFFDSIVDIIILELYVLLCLKGNRIIKIVMPFVAFLINTIISYGFMYMTSLLSGKTFEELALQSSIYRYIFVTLVNLINLIVFLIMLKINQKEYNLKEASNIIAFVGIPALAMAIIYMTTYILILTDYQADILPYIIAISVSMLIIAGVVWYMISRISRDNNIKTQLQLSKLRADMYENNIINSNKQIEEISKVKHDINNQLACIDELIVNNNSNEAHKICEELMEKMRTIYTPINTENPILNAVLNVELEKAKNNNIDFKIDINDDLFEFKNNTDLISLIGNLCDNSIEYLSKCSEQTRKMDLSINKHNHYKIISCKNRIVSSVLQNNPNLDTDKIDKTNHGKGLSIVKDIAKKYNGNIEYQENEGYLIITVVLDNTNLPKNP